MPTILIQAMVAARSSLGGMLNMKNEKKRQHEEHHALEILLHCLWLLVVMYNSYYALTHL